MINLIRTAIREPLLHFLVAGAGLFLLYNYAAGPDDVSDGEIVVSSGQIEHLTALFVKTWQRPPTSAELSGLVDNFILEEVLYREATAIGLDQDDTIIRRRLKQKMEFLVDDFSAANPADVDLQQFLVEQPERFRRDPRITFEHVYFVEAAPGEVDETLVALQSNEAIDSRNLNQYGLLPRRFDDASATTIAGQFGSEFSDVLFTLDTERWTGPVQSPYGTHLVLIEVIVDGRVPALDEIRDEVQREWLVDRRDAAQQAFFDSLRSRYTITVEDYVAPAQ